MLVKLGLNVSMNLTVIITDTTGTRTREQIQNVSFKRTI